MSLQTGNTRLTRTVRTRGNGRLNATDGTLFVLNDVDLSNVQELHESHVLRQEIGIDNGVFG